MTGKNRDTAGATLRLAVGVCLIGVTACLAPAGSAVPISIDMPADFNGGAWPTTFGVPFPKGALAPEAAVSLRVDGKPIITQTTPLATWDRDGRSVRWLLVDAQFTRAEAQGKVELAWGDAADSAPSPISVRRHKDGMVIDTGAARFDVATRGRFGINRITLANGDELVTPDHPVRFVIADHDGRRYEASGNRTEGGVVIEDHGPVRLALRSEGWYLSADDRPFCRHDIRLSFHAGSGLVRVLHTFIFTEHTDAAKVTDLAMTIPIKGTATTAAFGVDADNLSAAHVVKSPDALSLVQDYKTRWDLNWSLSAGADSQPLAAGARYGGWAALTGKHGGVTAALRDAWQNYPNQMEVRDNALIVHVWPGTGRPLDFSTRAILSVYGEDGIKNIDQFFKSQNKPYGRSIFDVPNNAMGLAKTHELWLDFTAGEFDAARSADVARQANTPVLAIADPAWNAASEALDLLHHRDPDSYPQVEAALDASFDRFVYWQRHHADYGWLDYGDVHADARGEAYIHKVAGGIIASPWRYWDSTHYGLPNSLWLLYLRSGERKYLQFAEANSRHCMDIDRCHHGNDVDRFTGTHYYCDWSIIQWGGAPPTYVMLTWYDRLDYMLQAYFLRGERRGLDVLREWGEAVDRFHGDPTKPFPLTMLPPRDIENARHFGPNMLNLLELYRVTWDERYLTHAKGFADALVTLTRLDEPGADLDPSSLSYIFDPMLAWWRFTGDDTFRRATLRLADTHLTKGSGQPNFAAAAAGFMMSGDTRYLDHGAAQLVLHASSIHVGDDAAKRGSMGAWASGIHPFATRTIPILLAAIERAPEAWKRENLPLMERSTALRMAGARHGTLYLEPATDAATPALLRLHLGHNQRGTLRDPRGEVLQVIEAPPTGNAIVEITLNPGATGVHTLTFDLRPTRSASDYIDRGFVSVIGATGVKYWTGPSTEDGRYCLFAPRLHFRVPAGVERFEIDVDTHTTWAAYAWHPVVHLYDAEGRIADTKEGPGAFKLTATVSPGQAGKAWSIGPLTEVSAPSANATWNKPMRDPAAHFPAFFKLPDGFAPIVSPRADMLPETP